MIKAAEFEFTASEDSGLPFKTIVMRETTGKDEQKAKALKNAKGAGSTLEEELMKLSLVSIDGKSVDQPFEGFYDMTTRARSYIAMAFAKINGAPDDLVNNFLSTSKLTV